MAAVSTPERQQWAVETMAIEPDDRLLEIGCGRGVAVSLICQRLTTGKVTAIDRSATMVRLASERNAAHVAAGKVEFRAVDLDSADLPEKSFDKIFAVNVSFFWLGTKPSQIDRVKRLLVPGGTLYVFNEPPTPATANAIGDKAEAVLTSHGFTTLRHKTVSRRGLPLTCVAAVLDRDSS